MEDKDIMEMRSQIALLRLKLEKEQIISNRLLKQTMKTRLGVIHRQAYRMIFAAAVSMFIFPMWYHMGMCSLPFAIATVCMMLLCVGFTWYYHRPLNDDLLNSDVATMIRTVMRFKKRYNNWLYYATPGLLIPWVLWCSHEIMEHSHLPEEQQIYELVPIAIGFTIGLAIGLYMHFKVIRNCNEILAQLEE